MPTDTTMTTDTAAAAAGATRCATTLAGPRRLARALLAPLALLGGSAFAGNAMVANSLTVYLGGSVASWAVGNDIWLHDGFDDGLALSGPALGTTGLSATYLAPGLPAANLAAGVSEQGGQLWLDPAHGIDGATAAGAVGRGLRLQLATSNADPAAGLTQAVPFGVALELSVDHMPLAGQSFGLRLADTFSNSNDVLDFSVQGTLTGTGLQVLLRRQDFQALTVTTLLAEPITVPTGADTLVLGLLHLGADSDLVLPSWAFLDTANQFVGGLPQYGDATTLFNGESGTLLSLRAVQAVPEPSALALLTGGLLTVAGLAARRRRGG